MKKKIKRISKMVMTIVLTATMLFGQLPSGLVLVANADTISGNGNSTLPDMSAGAAKYFNPDNGGGQIGDPKSLPDEEETSEEEGSEEDESETSSIEEESDSSKEKVEANSEKEIQSEEKTSEEKTSEEKTSEEKTSESAKNDSSDDSEDVGDSVPNPEPELTPVDLPEVEQKDGVDLSQLTKVYDTTNTVPETINVADFFNFKYDNEKISLISYVLGSDQAGDCTLYANFSCIDGCCFVVNEEITTTAQILVYNNFQITKKPVSITSIAVSSSSAKTYKKDDTDIPGQVVTYTLSDDIFEGDSITPTGVTYKLSKTDAGINMPVEYKEGDLSWGNNNYDISNKDDIQKNLITLNSSISVIKQNVTVSFASTISKPSDGSDSLPNETLLFGVFNGGEEISGVSAELSGSADPQNKWKYEDILPGNDKAINGAIDSDIVIYENNDKTEPRTDNYNITFDLKGNITVNSVDDGYIGLNDRQSSDYTFNVKKNDEELFDITFNSKNHKSEKDSSYYFNSYSTEIKVSNEDVKFYKKGSYEKEIKLNIINNTFFDQDTFKDIIIRKGNVFYGDFTIAYASDITLPQIDVKKIKPSRNSYSIDNNNLPATDSESQTETGIKRQCLIVIDSSIAQSAILADFDTYFEKGKNSVEMEDEKTVWCLAEDYAGNKNCKQVSNLYDDAAPAISVELVRSNAAFAVDEKDYYNSLTLSVSAQDLGSGLGYCDVYLIDGVDNPCVYGDKTSVYHDSNIDNRTPDNYGPQDKKVQEITYNSSSNYGYELCFLIHSIDFRENETTLLVIWDKENNTLKTKSLDDLNLAGYEDGTTRNEKIATGVKEQFFLDQTIAIVSANLPHVSVNFQDSSNPDEWEAEIPHYNAKQRTAVVKFENMGFAKVKFKNDSLGTGNNHDFTLNYNSTSHYYTLDDVNWTFPAAPGKIYEIALSEDLPFGQFDFGIAEATNNQKFKVIDSDKTPIFIKFDTDKNYVKQKTSGEDKYYFFKETISVTVTVTGEGLLDSSVVGNADKFGTDYSKLSYVNNGNSSNDLYTEPSKAGLETLKWEPVEEGNGYKVVIPYNNDGTCDLTVDVWNLGAKKTSKKPASTEKKYHEGEIYVIDTQAPEFAIQYEGYTNHIDGLEIENKTNYYYGLLNGVRSDSQDDQTNHFPTMKAIVKIKEANVFEDDIKVTVLKNGTEIAFNKKFNVTTNANNLNNESNIELTIPGEGNDGIIKIHVSYTDPAGHKMVSVIETKDGEEVAKYSIVDGEYSASERTDIIDTIQPVATYSITPLGKDESGNWIGHYEGDADYYKDTFSVKFAVEDDNYDDRYTKTAVVKEGVTSNNEMIYNSETKSFATTVNNAKANEGRYTFSITGIEDEGNVLGATDFAGNIMVFKKGDGTMEGTDPEPEKEGSEIGKYTTGVKVLDITAPIVNLQISTKADKQNLNEKFNNRFYFNNSFTGTFSVDELNYDSTKIAPVYGTTPSIQCDNYTTKEAPPANTPFDSNSNSLDQMIFEQSFGEEMDGLYVLSISGTDKAGNQIVKSQKGKDETDYISSTNPITSYVFVVDTVKPTVTVEMNLTGKEDTFYKATLKEVTEGTTKRTGYEFEKNFPYQRKPENVSEIGATISFTEVDQLPTNLICSMDSTKGGKNVLNYDYQWKRSDKTASVSGKQIYWFNTITIEDLAGNKIEAAPTNKIYLDETPPNIENDTLAPLVEFVAKVSSTERGPQGNPLYKGDQNVRIQAKVHDNQGEESVIVGDKDTRISSSGLYKVYYKVTVNGNDVTDSVVLEEERAKASDSDGKKYVHYYTSGPDYNNTENKEDEKLTYDDTLTFKFPTKDGENGIFNHNNIVLTVWTVDNAGNEGKPSTYSFGIDTISPSISVSYNNNEVQNGKYFKDPRTATITVTERNFDGGRIHISTESSAHVSGWSYSKGDPNGNGDDDKWTATVVYDTDGDYTFGVSGSDLVNHGASVTLNGVAPTEFTIDLTKPVIAVAFDNNRVANGRYYNANRRATIDITEHNFDAKDASVERTAAIAEGTVAVPGIGNWSRINDINRNEVYFGQDGDYTMKVDYVDLAGNIAETYVVDLFTIDTVAPELEIGGVEDKHAYNGRVAPSITYHDINYDKNSANIGIVGNKHKGDNSLDGNRTDERFGGSFVCNNIQEVRDKDDIYTAKASISDLAGNTTEKQVTFSVNRFGSTYIISDGTQKFLDKYYNQQGETLEITEINVNELASYGVTYSVDGNTSHNIVEGEEFTVQQAHDGDGWWEYNYRISGPKNFTDEGNYLVELKSRDGAANDNGNRFIQKTVSETYELPIEFVIDHSAPTLIMTGVEEGGRYRADERTVMIRYDDSISFLNSLKVYEGDKLVQEYDQKQLSEAGGEIQYQAKASNRKQEIRLEAVDMAGNQGTLSSGEFLLTSSAFIQFVNNTPLLIAAIAGLVLLFGVIIFLVIMLTRRKRY